METSHVRGLGLRQQALLAAVRLANGGDEKRFTAEELLVEAWRLDHAAWGLRGFEDHHPDAEKINKELNRRGSIGLVGQGLLERVGAMVYRLTTSGLHEASQVQPSDSIVRERADRKLEEEVKEILEHRAFRGWLADPSKPKYFREAGHFWGIAPGTPPRTVRERVRRIEDILRRAITTLDQRGVEVIAQQRGQLLYDRHDIQRCLEFQSLLKERFERDLRLLDPECALTDDTAAEQGQVEGIA